jgi:hypothetical protein
MVRMCIPNSLKPRICTGVVQFMINVYFSGTLLKVQLFVTNRHPRKSRNTTAYHMYNSLNTTAIHHSKALHITLETAECRKQDIIGKRIRCSWFEQNPTIGTSFNQVPEKGTRKAMHSKSYINIPNDTLRGLSPRANYTDRATATCRRS